MGDPMSDKPSGSRKSAKAKSPVDKASDLARQIWLAGVGAYGQAVDDTQQEVTRRVAQVSQDTSKFFEELVSRGSDLEKNLGALGKMSADVRAEGIRRGADMSLSLEDRLSRMRDMLGIAPAGTGFEEKVDRLAADVAALSAKLDLVLDQMNKPVSKPAAKKPAAKKQAATKKKPAAKKKTTARKKAPAKKKPVSRN
jgi:outer membrane murein-binding lipoprotein Lpp